MSNPLFNMLGGNRSNPLLNMLPGGNNFQQQLSQFAQQFSNQNPQEIVQNLLNSGQMTQQQFEQYRAIANQMTGRRF